MRTLTALFGGTPTRIQAATQSRSSPLAEFYNLLRSLYYSDIYDELDSQAKMIAMLNGATIHPIRNPTYRIVEFYARHTWPGNLPDALPIETENERIIDPIHLFWQWSNFASRKQVWARENSLLGDEFIKVATREDMRRVFMQLTDPSDVISFKEDERSNITYIHTETPFIDPDTNNTLRYWIEEWSRDNQLMRRWTTDSPGLEPKELGVADDERPFPSMGIDFVPYVRSVFRDVGDERGVGAVSLSIRKVWEADLIATALHQRLFRYNKADMVLESAGRDDVGRAAPPIDELNESTKVDVGTERFFALPSGWTLRQIVANLDYGSALAILQDHMRELENDMPELAYYKIREIGQVSGRAVRLLLTDAIATALEARGNMEDALSRVNKMALTMMRANGLIQDIGTFDNGDFEHTFEPRDIIPLSSMEVAEESHTRALADAVKINQLGWSKARVQAEWGLTDDEIALMEAQRDAVGDEIGAAILRQFDAGNLT
jgi:hypothetical protein